MHRISYLNCNVVCFPELSTVYLVRREYFVTPGEMTQFGVPKTMHYRQQMKPMFEFARKLLKGFVGGNFECKCYSN
jgi:hypothetical protein